MEPNISEKSLEERLRLAIFCLENTLADANELRKSGHDCRAANLQASLVKIMEIPGTTEELKSRKRPLTKVEDDLFHTLNSLLKQGFATVKKWEEEESKPVVNIKEMVRNSIAKDSVRDLKLAVKNFKNYGESEIEVLAYSLRLAAAVNKIQCLRYLIKDLRLREILEPGKKSGKIALHFAIENGNEESVGLLMWGLNSNEYYDPIAQLYYKNNGKDAFDLIFELKSREKQKAILEVIQRELLEIVKARRSENQSLAKQVAPTGNIKILLDFLESDPVSAKEEKVILAEVEKIRKLLVGFVIDASRMPFRTDAFELAADASGSSNDTQLKTNISKEVKPH